MYLCKPTRETLNSWRQLLEEQPLSEAEALVTALIAIDLDSAEQLEEILWEYTRLFIGPHRLPCPPLESVYTSPKRLMMQEAYDQVKEFYVRAGVEMGCEQVMPDHIGAELNFLSVLFARISYKAEERQMYEKLADEFLAAHLRNWVPSFTEDMGKASESLLYKALATITNDAITQCVAASVMDVCSG